MPCQPSVIVAILAASAFLIGLLTVAPASPATAATQQYKVVDADNDPYSGIYLRDGTSMSKVRKISARYMFYGTTVELQCGTWGEPVGPYANKRWHKVKVLSGATKGQIGWVADRYMNTPNKANEKTPGEPECGGSMYYSPPYPNDYGSSATIHKWNGQWALGSCNPDLAKSYTAVSGGKRITTLAGWSIGRLGPAYFLQDASTARKWAIDYVLLIDPGNYDDIVNNSCDKRSGETFTKWLKANPNAKLVILAGKRTAEDSHRGIQVGYFNYLRANGGPRNRVIVCNYNTLGHQEIFTKFQSWMNKPAITKNSCPPGSSVAWNP